MILFSVLFPERLGLEHYLTNFQCCSSNEASETKHGKQNCLHSNIQFVGTFESEIIRFPLLIQLAKKIFVNALLFNS